MKPSNGTVLSLPRLAAIVLSLTFRQKAAAGTALVYDGPGLCDCCAKAAAAAVQKMGLRVVMAGLEALERDRLDGIELLVVGGAEATVDIRRGMSKAPFRALRDYVWGGSRGLPVRSLIAGQHRGHRCRRGAIRDVGVVKRGRDWAEWTAPPRPQPTG